MNVFGLADHTRFVSAEGNPTLGWRGRQSFELTEDVLEHALAHHGNAIEFDGGTHDGQIEMTSSVAAGELIGAGGKQEVSGDCAEFRAIGVALVVHRQRQAERLRERLQEIADPEQRRVVGVLVGHVRRKHRHGTELVWREVRRRVEGEGDRLGEVFVDGTSNILTKGDFADLERLRELLHTIGEKSRLMQILTECIERDSTAKGDVQVVIGNENRTPSFQNCTLISAPYRIGNSSAIGTIDGDGPFGTITRALGS